MNEDLKQHLDAMEARLGAQIHASEDRTAARIQASEDRTVALLRTEIQGTEDRSAALIGSEIGSLHTQIIKTEERIVARVDAIDARQRRDAGLTTALMELIIKQTRWHEETDNAVADLAARHAHLARKLDEGGNAKAQ